MRLHLFIVVVVCLLRAGASLPGAPLARAAAGYGGTQAALQPSAAPSDAAVEAVARAYFSTQNNRDCDGLASLFAPEFSLTDPFGTPAVTSAAAVRSNCEQGGAAFRTIALNVTDVYVAGGGAAVAWRCTSVTAQGCALDFAGVDEMEAVRGAGGRALLAAVRGFYNATIPAIQFNCTHAA